MMGGGLFLLLGVGWIMVLRFVIQKETFIVGNHLDDALKVTNRWENLFTFHPIGIWEHPFNSTWGDTDRRQYFWEFFFRSAFFGEWHFDAWPLSVFARFMNVTAMLLFPVTIAGLCQTIRKRLPYAFPVFTTIAVLLVSSFLYRLISPYSPNQDFRFVPLLVLPVVYVTLIGILHTPKPLRHFFTLLLLVFVVSQTAFIAIVPFF
jgi:hypothetical protein